MTEDPATGSWHLDKRVPVALIFAIMVQTGTFIWWMAALDKRVDFLEKGAEKASPHIERIIKLEVDVTTIKEGVSEIKSLLRRPSIQP